MATPPFGVARSRRRAGREPESTDRRLPQRRRRYNLVKFSASPANAVRDEYIVECSVPEAGNDAALIAVFNSEIAAKEFAKFMNFLAELHKQCDSCSG